MQLPSAYEQPVDEKLLKRFFAKVNKHGPIHHRLKTRCHLWTATTQNMGYGQIVFRGKLVLAHRLAWFIQHGRWPTPKALHKCDTPACVRHDHLLEGTQRDNVVDMAAKGRRCSRKGELNGCAKITADTVREIRKSRAAGAPYTLLAKRFKLSRQHVADINNGVKWPHVQ